MNIAMTLKRMPTVDMQISDIVPLAGELIMDATSNKLKVGDGKTAIKDLPWVDLDIDSAVEESRLSRTARMFIENNIELIDNNDYDTLYSLIATAALAQEVTRALLKADLNPKPYLSKIPQNIRHILDPEDVWVEDISRVYTKSQMEAMLDEWNKKLFIDLGIQQSMINVGD